MSKERCEAVKGILKNALSILSSGACGSGRGVSLAVTHAEDAYLRVDYHMRQNGWTEDRAMKVVAATPAEIAGQANQLNSQRQTANAVTSGLNTQTGKAPAQTRSKLVPAAPIPQLNTGLMNGGMPMRDPADVMDDISLL